jgi:hypothetical protein
MPFNPFEDVRQPCKTEGCPRKAFSGDGLCTVCVSRATVAKHFGIEPASVSVAPDTPVAERCAIPGCGSRRVYREWCMPHLVVFANLFRLTKLKKGHGREILCIEPGCGKTADSRHRCGSHLHRWRKAFKAVGQPFPKVKKPPPTPCPVPGCGDTVRVRGFCLKHFGDVNYAVRANIVKAA